MGKMTNAMKKELAESMFINSGHSPELIVEKLGITRSTIYRWIKEKKEHQLSWKEQRDMIQSAPHKIKQFIDQQLLNAVETKKYDSKLSDFLVKVIKARENLDKTISAHTVISVFEEFDSFMSTHDLDKAKDFIPYHKAFIYHKAAQQ